MRLISFEELTSKLISIMVGMAVSAGTQIAKLLAEGYGKWKAAKERGKYYDALEGQREENRKWYEQKMAEDYTQRTDMQNILRKQRELLDEQYKRARATNIVAGGTDESLALQQANANDVVGETMADMASQASTYKEGVENQFREKDAQLEREIAGQHLENAQAITEATSQLGAAIGGLAGIGMGKAPATTTKASPGGEVLGGTTTFQDMAGDMNKAAIAGGVPDIAKRKV